MKETIPYKKILKLALATTPLMGFFGSTPIFVIERNQFDRFTFAFLSVSILITVFWTINILLLRIWERLDFRGRNAVRYLVSLVFCVAVIQGISTIFFRDGVRVPLGPPRTLPRHFPNAVIVPRPNRVFVMPALQALSINTIIVILIELVLLRETKLRIESENAQLKLANLEARHGRLKQQLHPHFLFNSLSILRSLIKRSPQSAEHYLERLSELLRFSTTNDSHTLVSLREELDFSRNYLEMQQVRFGKALKFSFDVPDLMQQQGQVPIYSVQLLVENAIKHNTLTSNHPLFIEITGHPDENTVVVANNLQKKSHPDAESGTGLKNLSERYQLLGKERIEVHQDAKSFYVTLKVLSQ